MATVLYESPGREQTNNATIISSAGGTIRDGEIFTVQRSTGGLGNASGININGIACTLLSIRSDFEIVAVAPADDLLHGVSYTMEIF